MLSFLTALILGFNFFVVFYFGAVNAVYSVLLTLALFKVFGHTRRMKYSARKEFHASLETPPITILIPVHNEEKVILRSIRSALAADYPFFEVIVINDGSSDTTLQTVIDAYRLRKIDRVYRTFLKTKPLKGFYHNIGTPNLLLIDKECGGKSDALNCGINIARSPYFCSVDAD